MQAILQNYLEWAPALARGTEITLLCTICTMVIASAIGLFVALLRIAHIPVLHQFIVAYVEIFRGLPTIVILFLAYFGLPSIGIRLSDNPIVVGVVALSFNLAAYLSEVFRAAILAIDPGQMEAAQSLGLSRRQGYVRVVLPQALLVAVPTLGSFLIGLLKDTSLLSFISVTELLKAGNDIVAATFLSFRVYILVGAVYVVLSLVSSRLVLWVERRLAPIEEALSRQEAALQAELPPDVAGRRVL